MQHTVTIVAKADLSDLLDEDAGIDLATIREQIAEEITDLGHSHGLEIDDAVQVTILAETDAPEGVTVDEDSDGSEQATPANS